MTVPFYRQVLLVGLLCGLPGLLFSDGDTGSLQLRVSLELRQSFALRIKGETPSWRGTLWHRRRSEETDLGLVLQGRGIGGGNLRFRGLWKELRNPGAYGLTSDVYRSEPGLCSLSREPAYGNPLIGCYLGGTGFPATLFYASQGEQDMYGALLRFTPGPRLSLLPFAALSYQRIPPEQREWFIPADKMNRLRTPLIGQLVRYRRSRLEGVLLGVLHPEIGKNLLAGCYGRGFFRYFWKDAGLRFRGLLAVSGSDFFSMNNIRSAPALRAEAGVEKGVPGWTWSWHGWVLCRHPEPLQAGRRESREGMALRCRRLWGPWEAAISFRREARYRAEGDWSAREGGEAVVAWEGRQLQIQAGIKGAWTGLPVSANWEKRSLITRFHWRGGVVKSLLEARWEPAGPRRLTWKLALQSDESRAFCRSRIAQDEPGGAFRYEAEFGWETWADMHK